MRNQKILLEALAQISFYANSSSATPAVRYLVEIHSLRQAMCLTEYIHEYKAFSFIVLQPSQVVLRSALLCGLENLRGIPDDSEAHTRLLRHYSSSSGPLAVLAFPTYKLLNEQFPQKLICLIEAPAEISTAVNRLDSGYNSTIIAIEVQGFLALIASNVCSAFNGPIKLLTMSIISWFLGLIVYPYVSVGRLDQASYVSLACAIDDNNTIYVGSFCQLDHKRVLIRMKHHDLLEVLGEH